MSSSSSSSSSSWRAPKKSASSGAQRHFLRSSTLSDFPTPIQGSSNSSDGSLVGFTEVPEIEPFSEKGWLIKEGGSHKSWKKRWFIVKNGIIKYMKQDGSDVLGYIDLRGATCVKDVVYKKDHCFVIPTLNRDFYIAASSKAQLDTWVAGLNSEVKRLHAERRQLLASIQSSIKTTTVDYTMKDFKILSKVDDEYNGWVWKCRDLRTKKPVIMRVYRKKSVLLNEEVDRIKMERFLLEKLNHPFLNKFLFSFQTSDKIHFVFESIEGTKMLHYFIVDETFPEDRVRFHCAEVVVALQYMHSKGVLYRGLTTENIWLRDDGHLCLGDFSCSKVLDKRQRTASIVTFPYYTAPEILVVNDYGYSADWWMLGILAYEMFTGKTPFTGKTCDDVYLKIVTDSIKFPRGISKVALDFLTRLLQKDLSKRMSDPEEIKKHDFFKGVDWTKIENQTQPPAYVPTKEAKGVISECLDDGAETIDTGLQVKFDAVEIKVDVIPDEFQPSFNWV